MNEFSILEILKTNTLLFSISKSFHLKQHINYLNFSIQKLRTLLILTLPQSHTILNILKKFLGWMSNASNNRSQNEPVYPHIIFTFARKYYTISEMLTVFSSDFLNLIYQHNVLLSESPIAAIRVSIPNLNLLIIVVPTFTNYKIYYCDNCPTLGH